MPSSGYRKQTMDFGDMSRDLQSAAASFTKMSAAAAGFVSLVGAFKTFELEVTKANSAIGGSAKTFKQLSDAARNFALVSKYSAGEAAGSMTMLAQAGFDAQEVMAAMPHVLQLAQASMENLDLVADTVASTIRTYNLSAEEASRVTNVFAASCVNSLATVNKLAFSFRQVGPVAAELGMSIEETAAALDVLYNRGLRGEQAGTALRNILVRLIKPTQDTLQVFSKLGIGLRNANGSARDLQAILKDLKAANIDDSYLAKIFGREALAASKTLIAATTGEYERMKGAITDTNTVARMANAQMNTLDGALKLIKNSLNEVGIILGQSVGPIVKEIASVIQDLAIYLRTTDSAIIPLIKNFGSFVAILGTAKFGLSKTIDFMKQMSVYGEKAAAGITLLSNARTYLKSGAGSLTVTGYANELRMIEIMKNSGTQWYTNVNEYYKSINNGVGISMKAAAEMKNLTAAQIANMTAVVAGADAWKKITIAVKGFIASSIKGIAVAAALTAVFKVYESFMQERERKQQNLKEAFPELEYLNQKIKELKVATANDLPAIVKQYKEAMEGLQATQEIGRRINLQGLSLVDGKVVQDPKLVEGLTKIKEATIKQIKEFGTINEHDLREIAKDFDVSYDILEAYLKGVKERLKNNEDTVVSGIFGDVSSAVYVVSRAEDAVKMGTKSINTLLETSTEALKRNAEENKKFMELVETKTTAMISDLTDAGSKLQWLVENSTDKSLNDKVKNTFITYILGMSYADAATALQEGRDKLKELLLRHNNDLSSVLKEFRTDFLPSILSEEELSAVIPAKADVDAEVTAKITPLDVTHQASVLQNMRKTVADMLSDYKITWEILTEEQYAQEKLNKLQAQSDANRLSTRAAQEDLADKIFKASQAAGLSFDAIEKTLNNVDKTTGAWLDKNRFIKEALKDNRKEVRETTIAYLEQIDLKSQELILQEKILEKEKERLHIEAGKSKYLTEHIKWLDEEAKKLEDLATLDFFTKANFGNGITAGLISVEEQVDSSFDMMKKGMEGFADYMSDSMYDVIDNWDKGWSSMREALRSTLVDMLKDMAKYFAKMAAYKAVLATFGSLGDNGQLSGGFLSNWVNSWWGDKKAKGGVYENGLQTFAKGGVVEQPTLFNTRTGKGLMGEAGPEAIMPLKRDRDGNLGVAMQGAGNNYSSTIIINAESGTAQVKSDADYNALAKSLDQQIRGVVLSTLVREKKPGGILA